MNHVLKDTGLSVQRSINDRSTGGIGSGRNLRILVSSAGRRVGLVECWRRAAGQLGIELTIIATDVDPDFSAACLMADQRFMVPKCTDPGFTDAMLDICEINNVALVVPTIDTELQVLADNAPRFEKIGTRVHVSDSETIALVRDKIRTMEALRCAGVPVPDTAELPQQLPQIVKWEWPLFLKPRSGSASRGLQVIASPEDIPPALPEPMLVQELLGGPEYTVNVFVDKNGSLRCAIPHERLRVRAGEVEKGITSHNETIEELATSIVAAVPGLRGVFCFQVMHNRSGQPRIIEINARFGGGYPLADRAGATFCQWLLEEVSGRASTASNSWSPNVVMIRYDDAVFLEQT